jgi:hypothetical protein
MTTRKPLIWEEQGNSLFVANIARGTQYIVHDVSKVGYGKEPRWVARRRTRHGSSDFTLGHKPTRGGRRCSVSSTTQHVLNRGDHP